MEKPQEVTIQPVRIPGSDDSSTRVWQTTSETAPTQPSSPSSSSSEQQFLSQPATEESNPAEPASNGLISEARNIVASSQASSSANKARRTRKKKPQTNQDFVIQYDGRFIGTFSPAQKLTSKSAFLAIAREMEAQLGARFDANKLDLFRPVPLKFDKPTQEKDAAGTFRWFE